MERENDKHSEIIEDEEQSEEYLHVTEVEGHLQQSIHLSLIEKIVN